MDVEPRANYRDTTFTAPNARPPILFGQKRLPSKNFVKYPMYEKLLLPFDVKTRGQQATRRILLKYIVKICGEKN
ncbi:unnamed protein product, partial [Mesorhabditis spiculigera]